MAKAMTNIQCQKQLREKAKNKVESMEKCLSDVETISILNDFKNQFNICETAYKVILADYLRQTKKSKGNNKNLLKITMTQVPSALNYAGYNFDKAFLNELFGAHSSQKGNKTVKKLRDFITHDIEEKSVKEILNRKEELFGYMRIFLSTIKNFDFVVDTK